MSGTLFVVATPIGNLEDLTLRALRVLREVDVIAAEDTRHTARLLAHHGIATPTVSFHEHNTRTRVPQLLARLTAGENIALVTDAGTPSVSDPGLALVQACIAEGLTIDPIPGPSAPLTAAIASGFPLIPWTILGFPPHRSKDRNAWFLMLAQLPHTISFFEAPHRIRVTLEGVAIYLGDRPIVVARELTKVHQEFLRGSARTILETLSSPRGEFTVVVGPAIPLIPPTVIVTDESLAEEVRLSTNTGPGRAAVAEVARRHGLTSRDVYAAVERVKKSVE